NVSFIEGVTLSTSSMHARYDNALSSTFQFDQRNGNPDKFQGNFRLSSTEAALTTEGPIGKKVTYIASVRRSYLEFLFKAIDLPIRPNYWDFQYKVNYKLNNKTSFNFIGLGSLDDFKFAVPRESTPESEYVIRSSPNINQWSYTQGFSVKHKIENGFINASLSRNMLNNALDKFADNNEGNEDFRTLKSQSQEIENKFRVEVNKYSNNWKFSYGMMSQYVKYNNNFYNKVRDEITDPQTGIVIAPAIEVNFDTEIDFVKLGAFGQVSRRFMEERLSLSLGLRTDMNSFTDKGLNPLNTLSYRLGASYQINNKFTVNASTGSYYKIPIYTVLGFRDENGTLVNKSNKYIQSFHYVAGL
ncbi:MAG: TonB-dependent receptor domain-containing protein, partial [Saprospiraceae bacterium]